MMSEIERNQSVQDEPAEAPRTGKMDRKTILIAVAFAVGLVLLIALNMR